MSYQQIVNNVDSIQVGFSALVVTKQVTCQPSQMERSHSDMPSVVVRGKESVTAHKKT